MFSEYNVRSFASNVAMLSKFSLALYQWLPIPNKNLSGNEDISGADILNVIFHVHKTNTFKLCSSKLFVTSAHLFCLGAVLINLLSKF
jgi:hypothetical protein